MAPVRALPTLNQKLSLVDGAHHITPDTHGPESRPEDDEADHTHAHILIDSRREPIVTTQTNAATGPVDPTHTRTDMGTESGPLTPTIATDAVGATTTGTDRIANQTGTSAEMEINPSVDQLAVPGALVEAGADHLLFSNQSADSTPHDSKPGTSSTSNMDTNPHASSGQPSPVKLRYSKPCAADAFAQFSEDKQAVVEQLQRTLDSQVGPTQQIQTVFNVQCD